MEINNMSGKKFIDLLNKGFRRTGNYVYLPICKSCYKCISIRIKLADFKFNKRQRRILRSNPDIEIQITKPFFTEEKLNLYNNYLVEKHQSDELLSELNYHFCYVDSCVNTIEAKYYLNGKLIGVGILDDVENILSTVYFFYDCDYLDRRLGTYSLLKEIEYAKSMNKDFYYLGYYVKNCGKMSYKANYRPCQLLSRDLEWLEYDEFYRREGKK